MYSMTRNVSAENDAYILTCKMLYDLDKRLFSLTEKTGTDIIGYER